MTDITFSHREPFLNPCDNLNTVSTAAVYREDWEGLGPRLSRAGAFFERLAGSLIRCRILLPWDI